MFCFLNSENPSIKHVYSKNAMELNRSPIIPIILYCTVCKKNLLIYFPLS